MKRGVKKDSAGSKKPKDEWKLNETCRCALRRIVEENPGVSSREIVAMAEAELGVEVKVTIRQVNRLRVKWGMNRPKGRPRNEEPTPSDEAVAGDINNCS